MQEKLKNRHDVVDANLRTQLKAGKIKNKEVEAWLEEAHQETAEKLKQSIKIARKEVEDWQEKAGQQIAMKVEDLINRGACSSSTKLEEKIEELKQTIKEGKEFTNLGVSLVVDDHSKKGVTLPAEKCIAWDDIQEEILQLLREDEVTRIAVCGMGGQKKQFDILKFQKSIARKLALDLKNEDQDAKELAGLISQKLQQGSCVLILDDVWEPFSLEDVGIPNLVGNNGCKLVLMTRLQQKVGRAMECEVIYVKPLPDDEALALFLDKVGSEVVFYPRYKSDIEPFLNQMLKKCNGLPLAIGVVAKTMRGKFDRYSWEMANKELSKSKEIVDSLKFSYDHLEEQYKKCFLYCALYLEDYEIPKEELIEFWIEEGFILDARGSCYSMICEGHVIFEKLIDNCMLELVKNKYKGVWVAVRGLAKIIYIEDCVSMHDLFREMVLNINPQFMVKAGMALEELPEEHEWREDILKEPNWLPSDVQGFYILDCKDGRSLNDISGFQDATDLQHCTDDRLGVVAKLAPQPVGTFSSLQKIKVLRCGKIKKLLPLRLLQYLQNLQTVKVMGCDQMEEIISSEYEGGEKAPEKFTLSNLERLLGYFQSLATIEVFYCYQMEELISSSTYEEKEALEKITLPNLQWLKLRKLPELKRSVAVPVS
ncbi:hypothetical protein SLEP1_g46285 [Rubroshorea leprosula]|uniref:NB-ARC domain-containing protein n=1 Tax=Rubroshorea leprosula TaxID=152421 RepID=A0AAV5LML1_9ROSI|nr:hypothetical protein SLEP1_g46285 [Rubroshorea leprosula]